jgi:RHS repeat-associated protein
LTRFLHANRSPLRSKTLCFHTDHLGSVAVITNEAGAVVERLAYDAWGKRRFPNGADDPAGSIESQTTRGFTGHEQLDDVALVHMNGRVYDPLLGRMISADPTVPDPLNAQAWNRYSYVGNDPLAFTDPSGFSWLSSFFHSVGNFFRSVLQIPIVRAVVQIVVTAVVTVASGGTLTIAAAALTAAASAAVITGLSGGNLGAMLRSAAIAGMTAIAFNVVGTLTLGPAHASPFSPDGTLVNPAGYAGNIAGHAAVGCVSSVASGGDCGSGALAGAAGAAATPVIDNVFQNPRNNVGDFVGGTAASAIAGGLASVAGGGKFENGAVTAAFGYMFNAAAGRAVGGVIGGAFGALGGLETGPLAALVMMAGHYAGGEIGSRLEDWLVGTLFALPAPNLQDHHIFPQQFEEFFSQRGIDIHAHTVTVGETMHLQGIHGSGLGDMPGRWNSQWLSFITQNPNATAQQVYQQAGRMMDQYGLSSLPIHPYRQ